MKYLYNGTEYNITFDREYGSTMFNVSYDLPTKTYEYNDAYADEIVYFTKKVTHSQTFGLYPTNDKYISKPQCVVETSHPKSTGPRADYGEGGAHLDYVCSSKAQHSLVSRDVLEAALKDERFVRELQKDQREGEIPLTEKVAAYHTFQDQEAFNTAFGGNSFNLFEDLFGDFA